MMVAVFPAGSRSQPGNGAGCIGTRSVYHCRRTDTGDCRRPYRCRCARLNAGGAFRYRSHASGYGLGAWCQQPFAAFGCGAVARPVDEQFHARFSARGRSYRYVLFNHPVRPALLHGRAGWCHNPLNLELMQRAASLLVEPHDFQRISGCRMSGQIPNQTIEATGYQPRWVSDPFRFACRCFLHHMVRNLVGSLVHVGKGRQAPDWLAQVLESRDRSKAAATFAPDGLYLNGVEYAEHWGCRPCRQDGCHESNTGMQETGGGTGAAGTVNRAITINPRG